MIMFTNYNYKGYLLIILFSISLFLILKVLFLSGFPDFTGYYYGAQHILNSQNPYVQDVNYFTPQSYPPFTLILFIPFTFLSYETASKLWVLFSILAAIYTIYLLSKILNPSFFSTINLFFSSLVFLSFPLKFTLGMGQINILALLLLTFAFYFIRKNKLYYSGFFLALSFFIKFFPILLLVYFIIRKKWKILGAFIITIITITGITTLILPPSTVLYYFQTVLPSLLSSWKGDYYNQALTGLLSRNITDLYWRELLRIIIPIILFSVNFFAILKAGSKTKQRENLEIASLVTLNVLINNFSWQHHYVFLILPFIIMTFAFLNMPDRKYLFIPLIISYILVSINFKNPGILPLLLQSHVFFGGLILWMMSIYILYKEKL